jgi:hypothetical protein
MSLKRIIVLTLALIFILPTVAIGNADKPTPAYQRELGEALYGFLNGFWNWIEDEGCTREGVLKWAEGHVEMLAQYDPERLELLKDLSTLTEISFLNLVALSSLFPVEGACTITSILSSGIAGPEGHFYNFGDPEYRSLLHLDTFLDSYTWPDDAYQKGVWDCSEMTVYIFNKLQREGFRCYIAVGKAPWDPSLEGLHAWVLVNTSDAGWMSVECTTFSRECHGDYFDYMGLFTQVYKAKRLWEKVTGEETGEFVWDWWEEVTPLYVSD